MNKKKTKIPNLFIVGAPKSATTSLYNYLKNHPDVFMSDRKEPQFFCTDLWEESDKFHRKQKYFNIRTKEDYFNLFKNAYKEKIIGESTTKYLYSKKAAENIYKFNPDAKIIIMLRNPVDFLYSYHSQCIVDSVENIKDFKKALELEKKRKNGVNIPPNTPVPSFAFYTDMATFSKQVKRYLDVFPKENVKVFIIDDLRNSPEKIYKEILEFLELNTNYKTEFKVANPNKKVKSLKLNSFLNSYSKILLTFLPRKTYKIFRKIYNKINIKYEKRENIDEDIRLSLMKKFYPEVKELSRILDKDLINLWGYSKI